MTTKIVDEQIAANRSGIGHWDSFSGHRTRLTAEICARAPDAGVGRLCLLGAGNAYDVDLAALAERYAEIHLVDIDGQALTRAFENADESTRARLTLHAGVDVSGVLDRLVSWSRRSGATASVEGDLDPAVGRVMALLPGPFDVVVSCCLLTQLQLELLAVVPDRHPAFEALRAAVNAIHLRLLARLLVPGGKALLVTDLTSNLTYPLEDVPNDADLGALMGNLIHSGNVIYASHPGLLSAEFRRNPTLNRDWNSRFPVGPWLWHNGPERIFLVYGFEISRLPQAGMPNTP